MTARLVLALLLLALAAPAFAAVTVNSTCTPAGSAGDVASLNMTCTIASYSSTQAALVIGINSYAYSLGARHTVTDGAGGTWFSAKILDDSSGSVGNHTEVWYRMNPPAGALVVTATPATNDSLTMGGVAFVGVDPFQPIRSIGQFLNGNPGSASASVTLLDTISGNMLLMVGSAFGGGGWTFNTAGFDSPDRWDLEGTGGTPMRGAGATIATTGGTVTLSATPTVTGFAAAVGIEVSGPVPITPRGRFDTFGGVWDVACPANPNPLTATITHVQRSGGTATITVSGAQSTYRLYPNAPIIISGVSTDSGSFNTGQTYTRTADSVDYTYRNADIVKAATVPTTTTFTFPSPGPDVANTATSGTATYARWWVGWLPVLNDSGTHSWTCTPLGHPMKLKQVQHSDWSTDGVDMNGIVKNTTLQKKYATGPHGDYQRNACAAILASMKRWGFNSLGEYFHATCYPYVTGYNTADGYLPEALRLPHTRLIANYLGELGKGSAELGRGKFWAQGYRQRYNNINYDTCGQRMGGDPFDPRFPGTVSWMLQTASHQDVHKNYYGEYLIGWFSDETDYVGFTRAGRDFCTYTNGVAENPCGISAGPHFGLLTLVSPPVMTLNVSGGGYDSDIATYNSLVTMLGTCGDVLNSRGYIPNGSPNDDTVFWAKQALVDWLQSANTGRVLAATSETLTLTDRATGVSMTRSGSTVTATKVAHPFIAKERITVAGCSDATFNTASGARVKTTAKTADTFTFTLAGAGTSATGCTVTTGAGYQSIANLNSAWGSSYTQFASTGVAVTGTSLGTGDGTTGSDGTAVFSTTLPSVPSAHTVVVKVAGIVQCADDGVGEMDRANSIHVGFIRGQIPARTITNATNAAPIVITTADPHGYWTGQKITITGVGGNTAANTTALITRVSEMTFSLNGTTGNGAYTSGGATTARTVCTVNGAGASRVYYRSHPTTPGFIQVTFTAPYIPLAGQAVTVDYIRTGFGDGTGLADEDGAGAHLPTNHYALTGGSGTADQKTTRNNDFDDFLFALTKAYYRPIRQSMDTYFPGRLALGIINMSNYCAPATSTVFAAQGQYLDIFGMSHIACGLPDAQARVDYVAEHGGLVPWWFWSGYTASAESPYYRSNETASTPACCDTQAIRASVTIASNEEMLTVKGAATNAYHIIGDGWWTIHDSYAEGNARSPYVCAACGWAIGLKTIRDNEYNGKEAGTAACTDPNGYPCGSFQDGNIRTDTISDESVVRDVWNTDGLTDSFKYGNCGRVLAVSATSLGLDAPEFVKNVDYSVTCDRTIASITWLNCGGGCSATRPVDGAVYHVRYERAVLPGEFGPFGSFTDALANANQRWLRYLTFPRRSGAR